MTMSLRPLKTVVEVIPYVYHRYLTVPPDYLQLSENLKVYHEELYSDDESPEDKSTPKSCLHFRYNWTPASCALRTYDDPFGLTLKTLTEPFVFTNVNPRFAIESLLNTDLFVSAPDWDRVVQKAVPSFRNDFSVINFLLELDDIPRLISKFRGIDDAVLRTNFGLLPLWADINAFYRHLNLITNRLTTIAFRLRRGISSTSTLTRFGVYKHPIVTPEGHKATLTLSYTATFRWSVRVRGRFLGTRLSLLLDLIGFYPDLGTLWNAVPFSFLVDYLLPVGEALEGDAWSKMDLWVDKACSSVKVVGTYTIDSDEPDFVNWVGDLQSFSIPNFGIGTFKYYRRDVTPLAVLDGVDLGMEKGLQGKQVANIYALLSSLGPRKVLRKRYIN